MRFEQASEVLNYARVFHSVTTESLRGYETAGGATDSDRLRDVLAERDERIERLERLCSSEAASEEFGSWFEIANDDGVFDEIVPPDSGADGYYSELLRQAILIGNYLCLLYRHIIEEADTEALREAFEDLLEQEDEAQRLLERCVKGQVANCGRTKVLQSSYDPN